MPVFKKMEPKSLIESGLLESYLLGQCDGNERALVERMAAAHPSVKAEMEAIETALENYARSHAVEPPAGLRERIMNSLKDIPESEVQSNRLRTVSYVAAAFAAGCLVLGYLFMNLRSENADLKKQIETNQRQIDDCTKRAQINQEVASLVRDSETRHIMMSDAGPDGIPKQQQAYVFYNTTRKMTYLDINSVAKPNPGKYLQAWAIVEGEAAPVSLGMVDLQSPEGWQKLEYKGTGHVNAFALSEEPNPKGSPKPTVVVAVGKT
jgi:anti-sigma-K factor RskA